MVLVGSGGNGGETAASWMDRFAVKRNDLRGRRQRNLRAEAILGHAQVAARKRHDGQWPEFKGEPRKAASDCGGGGGGGSVCDCESCALCQRHFYTGHAKCYCTQVFNAGSSGGEMDAVDDDPEVCEKFEEFFAQLDLASKRKRIRDGDAGGGGGGHVEKDAKRLRCSAA